MKGNKKQKEKLRAYETIRDQIGMFSIMHFEGKGFMAWLIKRATGSHISHSALVYTDLLTGRKFCYESTYSEGVHITPISDRIKWSNDKHIWITNLEYDWTNKDLEKVGELMNEMRGKKYEKSKWQLAKSAFDGWWTKKNKRDISTVFCSELVAEAFQAVGFLGTKKSSNEYTPGDLLGLKGLLKGKMSDKRWLVK